VSRGGPGFDQTAGIVQRLAVVMEAGLSPVSALRHVAAAQQPDSRSTILDAVADRLDSAHEVPDRLVEAMTAAPADERSAWAAIAAGWSVANASGAGLAPTLARLAEVLRALAQASREVEVALAGPVATGRIVLALPAVGVGLGVILGFDVMGAFATVPGIICLALGTGLIVLGVRWNRLLVRRARTVDATPGLALDLLAVGASGGSALPRARELVEAALAETGLPALDGRVDATLQFALAAGVPVVALLRAEAEEERRAARSQAARQAAELESRLLLPLGLCILPAFVVLGVVPIALSIISTTAVAL
jgi:tight adherence protein B